MNRELKLALIIGFSLVLLVTVLISDHLSKARGVKLAMPDVTPNLVKASEPVEPISGLPGVPVNKTAATEPTAGPAAGHDRLAMGHEEPAPLPLPEAPMTIDPMKDNGGMLKPVDLSGGKKPSNSDQKLIDAAAKGGVQLDPLAGTEQVPIHPGPPELTGGSAAPKMREYTVVEGDSMVKIAKKTLGDANKWNLIAQANPKAVGKKGEIRVGAKLQIPVLDLPIAKDMGVKIIDPLQQSPIDFGPSGKVASNTPAKKTTKPEVKPAAKPDVKGSKAPSKADIAKADPKKAAPTTYTVKQGDTLNTIAKRLLGSASRTEDLVRANPDLESEDTIQVGDVIKVPMS